MHLLERTSAMNKSWWTRWFTPKIPISRPPLTFEKNVLRKYQSTKITSTVDGYGSSKPTRTSLMPKTAIFVILQTSPARTPEQTDLLALLECAASATEHIK